MSPRIARQSLTVDGDDAFSYALTEADYEAMADGFTVECSFRYTEEIASTGTICGNRQGGGFGIIAKDDQLQFMVHDGDGYKYAKAPMNINQWYHAVGVFDGETIKLYVDGQLMEETATAGSMLIPPNASSHNFVIGADSSNGGAESFALAAIDDVRMFENPLTAAQVQSLNDRFAVMPEVDRQPDVLSVDFEDGAFTDTAAGRTPREIGDVPISADGALNRQVARFDGTSSVLYPLGDAFEAMGDGFTLECSFRFDGELPSDSTNICASKEGGGFGLVTRQGQLAFMVHDGAGYKYAQTEFETDRWYHAVGVFDGSTVQLYLDGQLVAETPTDNSTVSWQGAEAAHNMALGADAANHNSASGHATATIDEAKLYSDALFAEEIVALSNETFQQARQQALTLEDSAPAAGEHLTEATEFDVTWNMGDLVSRNTTYALDGEPVEPGEQLGAGLAEGNHELTIEGTTVFGQPIDETIPFTSGSIPTDGGSEISQGEGSVTLSARAESPSGADVATTFYEGTVDTADSGFQGVVSELPETLEFDYDEHETLDGSGESLSADQNQLPFQRFDIELADGVADGQTIRWAGAIDPARQAQLLVWNTNEQTWDEVATGRGLAEGQLILAGELSDAHVSEDTARAMVIATDPFSDDLDEPVQDGFADSDEYDFSIAHLTDTQYISEGAAEDSYSEEQREVWADAYLATMQYLADNRDEHNLAYVAHTGDVIENWHREDYDNEAEMRQIATEEYEFAAEAQEILDAAEIPNGVLPGNHDNRTGTDTGADAMFNDYFGPERYEALETNRGWQDANASHHPYAEGDNSNHYDLFTAGGLDFIALHLGYGVDEDEVAWANEVLEQYSDRNAMVMTHAHKKASNDQAGRGSAFSVDGDRIDDDILKQHDNVFLVLSGHEHGVSIDVRQDVGSQNNHVVELLADYQRYLVTADELGLSGVDGLTAEDTLRFGGSFFRMLQFDVDRSELIVDTYSPLLNNFGATEYDSDERYNGTEDDTRLPIQLTSRTTSFETENVMVTSPTDTVIGEATAQSGWPASVEWAGLEEGETYAWYATSVDTATGEELAAGQVDHMGVFTAVAAGTDTEAPELQVPADPISVAAGDTFDPMEGVEATDNTDGDVTDAVQVIGSVDTETPGIYTLTYVVEDANGNQAIASRSVTVTEAESSDGTGAGENQDGEDTGNGEGNGDAEQNGGEPDGEAPGGSGSSDSGESTGTDKQADDAESVDTVSSADAHDETGLLASTGTQRTIALIVAGLLSVGAGTTAWFISHRRKTVN
ncbi:MAG: DUF5011 domain-containing protein [Micrococcaceae bacterium]|nr:DUF5011 domain-containing protein [Micrococcaceae bacterium]